MNDRNLSSYISYQVFRTKNQLDKIRSGKVDEHDACCGNYSVEETKKIYDSISKSYDDKVGFDEWLTGVDRLRKKVMLNIHGDVLEVAAGSGRNLEQYEKRRDNINSLVLSDKSVGMLRQAKEKFSKDFSKQDIVAYKVIDAHNMPFNDNQFDCSIDTFGLCSFEDPVKVLKEMNRVTKPGGKIILLEHGVS